jgi:predicted phosphodiesterase
MIERTHHDLPHPYRCAEAAIEEAVEWGAELLVIKGDAAQHETASDFAELGRLVDSFPELPMLLIPGNHDVDGRGGPNDTIPLTVGDRALPYTRGVDHHHLPGLTVLVADTAIPGRGRGTVERTAPQLVEHAAASEQPVFIGLHHQLHPHRVPRHWPIGIAADESRRFLDRIDEVTSGAVVSCGHSHRNRARTHRQVLVTEVGSTKDWPGVWAGYAVHEGGIRQVVRRVARHDAICWTEFSRDAVNGLWGLWAPGPLDQRCISHRWPIDARPGRP